MSKAVLVMDMPEGCNGCIFEYYRTKDYCCYVTDKHLEENECGEYKYKKPDWCPLVGLPERRSVPKLNNEYDWHDNGWNACLDAITGGEKRE